MLFAGNFAPENWALCQGQIIAITQNQALFSILGTTYGGDGRTTFSLPDLRGRVPVGAGQGPGLVNQDLGSQGKTEGTSAAAGQPGNTVQAVLGMNYVICMNGNFPRR
jgi:microcystin-dependent protein